MSWAGPNLARLSRISPIKKHSPQSQHFHNNLEATMEEVLKLYKAKATAAAAIKQTDTPSTTPAKRKADAPPADAVANYGNKEDQKAADADIAAGKEPEDNQPQKRRRGRPPKSRGEQYGKHA
ncbi:uncharacterized protein F4822DRAFT_425621 [Hypoxylon trugodes]|uniref:uncharacterized protein n=1 Tax=Hypoxylon trugodes TaxID=326681 RepID=UPI00219F7DBD|nr:uncharacterized protein F4822DRAFT_425621 [Hypoxylon trugodes]KAI1392411.1 hypothetical protein F4822DRAFT_425621 [Hypoxylon trugodes]